MGVISQKAVWGQFPSGTIWSESVGTSADSAFLGKSTTQNQRRRSNLCRGETAATRLS
jgi:hypothetical protein